MNVPAPEETAPDSRSGDRRPIGAWLAFAALLGVVLGLIQAFDSPGAAAPRHLAVSAVEQHGSEVVVRVIAPILN